MELAIDTSTSQASLALAHEGKVLAELSWFCGQNHSVELLPNLDYLLRLARTGREALSGLVVAKGPGSYNGLRVGLATAKGLALALGLPLVGISTLEVEAYSQGQVSMPICPLHAAGRGEIAWAIFQFRQGQLRRLEEEKITGLDELALRITRQALFCGELTPELAQELKARLKAKVRISPPASNLRRAGFLAELGWHRLQIGDVDNPATLQPLYLRRPPITVPKKLQGGAP